MRKFVICALVLLTIGTTTAALAYENSSVVGQMPGQVVVLIRSGVTISPAKTDGAVEVGIRSLDNLATRYQVSDMNQLYAGMTGNLQAKSKADLDRVWTVDFPAEIEVQTVIDAYSQLPEVERVWGVDICKMTDAWVPNDPDLPSQWHLRNTNLGNMDIRALGGWQQAIGDDSIIVAVPDSGTDWMHPDLGGTGPDYIDGNIWINWTEWNGDTGVDDDGNGVVDDYRGWDFIASGSSPFPGQDLSHPDNDPMDYNGDHHGTMVAGCVAALTDNGIGISGTAPNCKIMPLRIGYVVDDGEGNPQGIVVMTYASQAIIYAANNGANIISCSWGNSSIIGMACDVAQGEGILIIESAGNNDDENPSYLGTRNGVISVAATNQSDGKAPFSSYGTWVEISAPGVDIYTTFYNDSQAEHTYTSTQGTSFSAPITAGSAALIWMANPGMNYFQVTNVLTSTADNIDDANPLFIGKMGAGRINLLKALGGDDFIPVPEELPTLLDALNEASYGDTIALRAGEIYDEITVLGKGLKLLGGYNADFSSRDPSTPTIVEGSVSGSALQFSGEVLFDTEVDGFHISGGGGKIFSGIPYYGRYGGGIMLNGQSPTLRNIVITDCSTGSSSILGCGAGIAMNASSPVLENVSIYGCTSIYGAGVFIFEGSPTFTNCHVYDNEFIFDNLDFDPIGGGVHIVDADVTMSECTVHGHADLQIGGGMYVGGYDATSDLDFSDGEIYDNTATDGGNGLHMTGGTLDLSGTSIVNNTVVGANTANGGGFFLSAVTTTIDNCLVQGCSGSFGGGGFADACPSFAMTNTVMVENTAGFFGGALEVQNALTGELTNNTFAYNNAVTGAGVYVVGSPLDVGNNISAFNTGAPSFGNGFAFSTPPASVVCNDVYGNGLDYSGITDPTGTDGNVSVDPDFCDVGEDNYHVTPESPCAPAHSGGCDLIGALSATCVVDGVPGTETVPTVFQVDQNFPNPFNPITTIRFALPQAAHTTVTIFDLAGRQVRQLVDEDLDAKIYEVQWNGRNDRSQRVAAGVYFYQVISGEHSFAGRMALVK